MRRILNGLALIALGLLSACDAGIGVLGPEAGRSAVLSGRYEYRAWSDYDGYEAWWGVMELTTVSGGEIRGRYHLPRQCVDSYGYEADCYGRVVGYIERDGTLSFGLDEGWLRHEGILRHSPHKVTGFWEARLLGSTDRGTFELTPY